MGQGWAEAQVRKYLDRRISKVADVIEAEHARAVRIVDKRVSVATERRAHMSHDQYIGYIEACNDILAAIQKGRA